MARLTSPCIGVCKFKRPGPAGVHCIGCSMTRPQKKIAKKLKKRQAAEGFVALVMAQQQVLGRFTHWKPAYLERCRKKGIEVPRFVLRAG